MGLFSGPDVEELKQKRDFEGLAQALGNRKAREEAISAIAQLGRPEAVRPVLSVAGGAKPATLDACGTALNRLGQPAVDGLMSEVDRDEPEGQALRAAAGLGNLDPALAMPALTDLAGSEDPMRRVYASGGLGALGTPEAVELLGELLQDDEMVVRISAVSPFGLPATNGGAKARELMTSASLNDPEQVVRDIAADNLARLG